MRILYLITKAEHGGAQSHLLQLVSAAVARGQVLVATGEAGSVFQQYQAVGAECVILDHLKHPPNPQRDAAAVFELSRLIRRFEPDLVHAHSGKAGLIGRVASALNHVPSVYTAHGFAFAEGAPLMRRLPAVVGEWVAARAGSFTIAVSEAECRLAMRYHIARPTRTAVIFNGAEESTHRAIPELAPPVIAMVARFAYPKQQDLLIRAFARAAGNARLWLIGDGPEFKTAMQTAQRSGVNDRILFWGDRNDVPELLAQAQMAALISRHEGFGLSLVEAMSVGLPVIATDTGGMREIVRHGTTGLLVPCNAEAPLQAAIEQLIADPERRKQMGSAGLRRFRANFSAHQMIERTFRVYDAVLGSSCEARNVACSACAFPQACARHAVATGD